MATLARDISSDSLSGRIVRAPSWAHGRFLRQAFWFLGGATALGGASALQLYSLASATGHPVPLCDALYWGMRGWYEWLLLLPFVAALCRRWPVTRSSWPAVVAVHLAGLVLFPLVHAFLSAGISALYHSFVGWDLTLETTIVPALGRRLQLNVAAYLGIVIAYHTWNYSRRLKQRDREVEALTHSLTEARLQALQAQLNPHFLFNTLNTISSLVLTDAVAANRVLAQLAHVLRFSLDSSGHSNVPLEREVTFVRHYLEIERARFGDRIEFIVTIDPAAHQVQVPALLLHPIVENSVRYAARASRGRPWVEIRARLEAGLLVVEVSDSGPGFSETWDQRPEQRGIGLGNTRDRLRLIPGARLEIGKNENGGALVRVKLPAQNAVPAVVPAGA